MGATLSVGVAISVSNKITGKQSLDSHKILRNNPSTLNGILGSVVSFVIVTSLIYIFTETQNLGGSLLTNIKILFENSVLGAYNNFLGILKKKQVENIFYLPVTTDRSIFLDKVLLQVLDGPHGVYFGYWSLVSNFFDIDFGFDGLNLNMENYVNTLSLLILVLLNILLVFYLIKTNVLVSWVFVYTALVFVVFWATSKFTWIDLRGIDYLIWLLDESFLTRNTYIDSNYFLTNDTMKGIERFSDLAMPWFAEGAEVFENWGAKYTFQEQIDRLRERERHFIMNDFNSHLSPNLYSKLKEDGSFLAYFEKPIRRLSFWLDIMSGVAFDRELIKGTWKKSYIKNESGAEHINPKIIENIWNNESGFFNVNPNAFRVKTDLLLKNDLTNHIYKFKFLPLGSHTRKELDFILPQKNNIIGESIQKPGGLLDRKQIVYRGSVNTLPDIPENHNIEIRTPDFTKKTNYIFEKTLQNERVREYNNKWYLKNFLKRRLSYYNITKPMDTLSITTQPNHASKNTQINVDLLCFKKYAEKNKNKKPINLARTTLDFQIDRLSRLWALRDRRKFKERSYSRKYSYDYESLFTKSIKFFGNEQVTSEILNNLVAKNKLGLGRFTYYNAKSIPWVLDNTQNFENWLSFLKTKLKTKKINKWSEIELNRAYMHIKNSVEDLKKFGVKKNDINSVSGEILEGWGIEGYSEKYLIEKLNKDKKKQLHSMEKSKMWLFKKSIVNFDSRSKEMLESESDYGLIGVVSASNRLYWHINQEFSDILWDKILKIKTKFLKLLIILPNNQYFVFKTKPSRLTLENTFILPRVSANNLQWYYPIELENKFLQTKNNTSYFQKIKILEETKLGTIRRIQFNKLANDMNLWSTPRFSQDAIMSNLAFQRRVLWDAVRFFSVKNKVEELTMIFTMYSDKSLFYVKNNIVRCGWLSYNNYVTLKYNYAKIQQTRWVDKVYLRKNDNFFFEKLYASLWEQIKWQMQSINTLNHLFLKYGLDNLSRGGVSIENHTTKIKQNFINYAKSNQIIDSFKLVSDDYVFNDNLKILLENLIYYFWLVVMSAFLAEFSENSWEIIELLNYNGKTFWTLSGLCNFELELDVIYENQLNWAKTLRYWGFNKNYGEKYDYLVKQNLMLEFKTVYVIHLFTELIPPVLEIVRVGFFSFIERIESSYFELKTLSNPLTLLWKKILVIFYNFTNNYNTTRCYAITENYWQGLSKEKQKKIKLKYLDFERYTNISQPAREPIKTFLAVNGYFFGKFKTKTINYNLIKIKLIWWGTFLNELRSQTLLNNFNVLSFIQKLEYNWDRGGDVKVGLDKQQTKVGGLGWLLRLVKTQELCHNVNTAEKLWLKNWVWKPKNLKKIKSKLENINRVRCETGVGKRNVLALGFLPKNKLIDGLWFWGNNLVFLEKKIKSYHINYNYNNLLRLKLNKITSIVRGGKTKQVVVSRSPRINLDKKIVQKYFNEKFFTVNFFNDILKKENFIINLNKTASNVGRQNTHTLGWGQNQNLTTTFAKKIRELLNETVLKNPTGVYYVNVIQALVGSNYNPKLIKFNAQNSRIWKIKMNAPILAEKYSLRTRGFGGNSQILWLDLLNPIKIKTSIDKILRENVKFDVTLDKNTTNLEKFRLNSEYLEYFNLKKNEKLMTVEPTTATIPLYNLKDKMITAKFETLGKRTIGQYGMGSEDENLKLKLFETLQNFESIKSENFKQKKLRVGILEKEINSQSTNTGAPVVLNFYYNFSLMWTTKYLFLETLGYLPIKEILGGHWPMIWVPSYKIYTDWVLAQLNSVRQYLLTELYETKEYQETKIPEIFAKINSFVEKNELFGEIEILHTNIDKKFEKKEYVGLSRVVPQIMNKKVEADLMELLAKFNKTSIPVNDIVTTKLVNVGYYSETNLVSYFNKNYKTIKKNILIFWLFEKKWFFFKNQNNEYVPSYGRITKQEIAPLNFVSLLLEVVGEALITSKGVVKLALNYQQCTQVGIQKLKDLLFLIKINLYVRPSFFMGKVGCYGTKDVVAFLCNKKLKMKISKTFQKDINQINSIWVFFTKKLKYFGNTRATTTPNIIRGLQFEGKLINYSEDLSKIIKTINYGVNLIEFYCNVVRLDVEYFFFKKNTKTTLNLVNIIISFGNKVYDDCCALMQPVKSTNHLTGYYYDITLKICNPTLSFFIGSIRTVIFYLQFFFENFIRYQSPSAGVYKKMQINYVRGSETNKLLCVHTKILYNNSLKFNQFLGKSQTAALYYARLFNIYFNIKQEFLKTILSGLDNCKATVFTTKLANWVISGELKLTKLVISNIFDPNLLEKLIYRVSVIWTMYVKSGCGDPKNNILSIYQVRVWHKNISSFYIKPLKFLIGIAGILENTCNLVAYAVKHMCFDTKYYFAGWFRFQYRRYILLTEYNIKIKLRNALMFDYGRIKTVGIPQHKEKNFVHSVELYILKLGKQKILAEVIFPVKQDYITEEEYFTRLSNQLKCNISEHWTFKTKIENWWQQIYEKWIILSLGNLENIQIYYKAALNQIISTPYQNKINSYASYLNYIFLIEGGFDFYFKKIWWGVESWFELAGQKSWLSVCILFDFLFEKAVVQEKQHIRPWTKLYKHFITTIDELVFGIEEDVEDLSTRSIMAATDFGERVETDFTTLNKAVQIQQELPKLLGLNTLDFLQVITGLDSPELGGIYPSFDITIPIKSLWLVGVFYYDPESGGTITTDFAALWSFFKVLYLDRRFFSLSRLYQLIEFKQEYVLPDWNLFFKLRLNYLILDCNQLMDVIFINPLDFLNLAFFYLIYLTSYFGIISPILCFILLIYFGKFNNKFENKFRKYSYNDFMIIKLALFAYNYFLYRFIYLLVSNVFLFVRMTFAAVVILSGVYVLTEGFHIFSVLRIFDNDQENTKYLNGLFFQLERDPFVEKHVPSDEVWDEFKYDSQIDDDWGRTHFHRPNAEILGGVDREVGTLTAQLGFAKKYDYLHEFDAQFNNRKSHTNRQRNLNQIHNRVVDEASFNLKFIADTELEREFFREFEAHSGNVEGGTKWLFRSKLEMRNLRNSLRYVRFFKQTFKKNQRNLIRSEFMGGGSRINRGNYDLFLYNIKDPKWLFNESAILSERPRKPAIFNYSLQQLYDTLAINNPDVVKMESEEIANNRLENLIKRNKGDLDYNPILDMWDTDWFTDRGLTPRTTVSYGSLQNNIATWPDATAEPITQLIRTTKTPAITDTVYFNHVVNDEELDIDFYKTEHIMLETLMREIELTRLPYFPNKKLGELTIDTEKKKAPINYRKKLANTIKPHKKTLFGRKKPIFDILDENDISTRFMPDREYKYKNRDEYLEKKNHHFEWILWDLNNRNPIATKVNEILFNDFRGLNLKNVRRRDLFYNKLEGVDRPGIFKESIIREDRTTEMLYKIQSTLNKYKVMNKNAFYEKNEDVSKTYSFGDYLDHSELKRIWYLLRENQRGMPWHGGYDATEALDETNEELNPSDSVDDRNAAMWGIFENYYDNGLKQNLNNETIKFNEYKLRHKKKNNGLLYKYLYVNGADAEVKKIESTDKELDKINNKKIPQQYSEYFENLDRTPEEKHKYVTELGGKLTIGEKSEVLAALKKLKQTTLFSGSSELPTSGPSPQRNVPVQKYNRISAVSDKNKPNSHLFWTAVKKLKKIQLNPITWNNQNVFVGGSLKPEQSVGVKLKKYAQILRSFITGEWGNYIKTKRENIQQTESSVVIFAQRQKNIKQKAENMGTYFNPRKKLDRTRLLEHLEDAGTAKNLKWHWWLRAPLFKTWLNYKDLTEADKYKRDLNLITYSQSAIPHNTIYEYRIKALKNYMVHRRHLVTKGVEEYWGPSEVKRARMQPPIKIKDFDKLWEEFPGKSKDYNIWIKHSRVGKAPLEKSFWMQLPNKKFHNETPSEQARHAKLKKNWNKNRNALVPQILETKRIGSPNFVDKKDLEDPTYSKMENFILNYNVTKKWGKLDTEFEKNSEILSEILYNTVLEDNWTFDNKLKLNFQTLIDKDLDYKVPRAILALENVKDTGEGEELIKKLKNKNLQQKENLSWQEYGQSWESDYSDNKTPEDFTREESENEHKRDSEDYYLATDLYDASTDTGANPLIDNPDETNWGYVLKQNPRFGSLRNNLDFLSKDVMLLPKLHNKRSSATIEEHNEFAKSIGNYDLAWKEYDIDVDFQRDKNKRQPTLANDTEKNLMGDYDSRAHVRGLSWGNTEERGVKGLPAAEITDSTVADFLYGEEINEIPGFNLVPGYLDFNEKESIRVYINLIKKVRAKPEDLIFREKKLRRITGLRPWGMDIKAGYEWSGNQIWNLEENFANFASLLEDKKYKLWDLRSKKTVFEKTTPDAINKQYKKAIKPWRTPESALQVKHRLNFTQETQNPFNLNGLPVELLDYNKEKIRELDALDRKIDSDYLLKLVKDQDFQAFGDLEKMRFSTLDKFKNLKKFSEYEEPDLEGGESIWEWDNELNQSWDSSLKYDNGYSKYNFIQGSIKQKLIQEDYFSKNIPIKSHVVPFKEVNNLNWYLRKQKKRLKLDALLGGSTKELTASVDQTTENVMDWDSKIEAPTSNFGILFSNYNTFGFDKGDSQHNTGSIDNFWITAKLQQLLNRTRNDQMTMDIYETMMDEYPKDFTKYSQKLQKNIVFPEVRAHNKSSTKLSVGKLLDRGVATVLDEKKFKESLMLIRRSAKMLNATKLEKMGSVGSRASQDLQHFLETNMLEDPDLVDFKTRQGKKLLLLHRGFNMDDFIKNKSKTKKLSDNYKEVTSVGNPPIGSTKLKSIVNEIYSTNESIVVENENQDYFTFEPGEESGYETSRDAEYRVQGFGVQEKNSNDKRINRGGRNQIPNKLMFEKSDLSKIGGWADEKFNLINLDENPRFTPNFSIIQNMQINAERPGEKNLNLSFLPYKGQQQYGAYPVSGLVLQLQERDERRQNSLISQLPKIIPNLGGAVQKYNTHLSGEDSELPNLRYGLDAEKVSKQNHIKMKRGTVGQEDLEILLENPRGFAQNLNRSIFNGMRSTINNTENAEYLAETVGGPEEIDANFESFGEDDDEGELSGDEGFFDEDEDEDDGEEDSENDEGGFEAQHMYDHANEQGEPGDEDVDDGDGADETSELHFDEMEDDLHPLKTETTHSSDIEYDWGEEGVEKSKMLIDDFNELEGDNPNWDDDSSLSFDSEDGDGEITQLDYLRERDGSEILNEDDNPESDDEESSLGVWGTDGYFNSKNGDNALLVKEGDVGEELLPFGSKVIETHEFDYLKNELAEKTDTFNSSGQIGAHSPDLIEIDSDFVENNNFPYLWNNVGSGTGGSEFREFYPIYNNNTLALLPEDTSPLFRKKNKFWLNGLDSSANSKTKQLLEQKLQKTGETTPFLEKSEDFFDPISVNSWKNTIMGLSTHSPNNVEGLTPTSNNISGLVQFEITQNLTELNNLPEIVSTNSIDFELSGEGISLQKIDNAFLASELSLGNNGDTDLDYIMTGGLNPATDLSKIQENILILNKKNPGFAQQYNLNKNLPHLVLTTKIEPNHGSDRFKSYKTISPADSLLKPATFKTKFHLEYEPAFVSKYNLIREDTETLLNADRSKSGVVFENTEGFFSDGIFESDLMDQDYIRQVAMPVSKTLNLVMKENTGVDYLLFEDMGEPLQKKETKFNRIAAVEFRYLRHSLNSLLRNSGIHSRAKKHFQGSDGVRRFNSYESLTPSPYIRSLSIDSNLFSKINNLRIYGAGRLEDYVYRPKIKQLIKNNTHEEIESEDITEFDEFIDENIEDEDLSGDNGWSFSDDEDEDEDDEDWEETTGEDLLASDNALIEKNKNKIAGGHMPDNLAFSELCDGDSEDEESITGADTQAIPDEEFQSGDSDLTEVEDYGNIDLMDLFDTLVELPKKVDYLQYDVINFDDNQLLEYIDEEEPEDWAIALPNESLYFYGENNDKLTILGEEALEESFSLSDKQSVEELDEILDSYVDDDTEDEFSEEGVEQEDPELEDDFTEEEDFDDEDWDELNWLYEDDIEFDEGSDSDEFEDGDYPIGAEEHESRDNWLFELYQDTYKRQSQLRDNLKEVTEEELQDLENQLTASFKNLIEEGDESTEEQVQLLHNLETALFSGNIYGVVSDVETDWATTNRLYNINPQNSQNLNESDLLEIFKANISDDLEDGEELEADEDYESEVWDLEEELVDLEDLLYDQGAVVAPLEPLVELSSLDHYRRFGLGRLKVENLDKRIADIDYPEIEWNRPINNLRETPHKYLILPGDKKAEEKKNNLKFRKLSDLQNRYIDNNIRDWNLGLEDFEGDLDLYAEMETIKEFVGSRTRYDFSKDKQKLDEDVLRMNQVNQDLLDTGLDDLLLGKKLKNIGHWEDHHMLDELGDYFANKIDEVSQLTGGGESSPLTNLINNKTNLNTSDGLTNKAYADSDMFLSLRNRNLIKKAPTNLHWIPQKSLVELRKNQEFKVVFGLFRDNYTLPKSIFNLNSDNLRTKNNFGELLRKATNIDLAAKPRIKWKKLKKKYMNHLDTAERVITSLANASTETPTTATSNNFVKTQKPLQDEILQLNFQESPRQAYLGVESDKIEKISINQAIIPGRGVSVSLPTKTQETYWAGNSYFGDFRNILQQLKKTTMSQSFEENYQRFSRLNPNEVNVGDEVLVNSPEMTDFTAVNLPAMLKDSALGAERLVFGGDEVIEDDFTELDELLLQDSEIEDTDDEDAEDFYSRIRSNTVALMQSTKHDSILPSEVLSAFLGKLPNIDISQKLNEEIKKPFFYEIEKKKTESGYKDLSKVATDDLAILRKNFKIAQINAPIFSRKSRILNEFALTKKRLKRPGAPLRDMFFRYNIQPFNQFSNKKLLLDRGVEYGMGDFVYQNNAVNRRSDVLQIRTFGPEIRLNSTVWGYGKLDKALTQNVNSEEDYGLLDGLGFPEIVEQNMYDETSYLAMAYGHTPFSNKFSDFIWKLDPNLDDDEKWADQKEVGRMNNSLFGLGDDDDAPNGIKTVTQLVYLLNQFFNLNDYKVNYGVKPGYGRFVNTHTQNLTDSVKGRLRLPTDRKPWGILARDIKNKEKRVSVKRDISQKLYQNKSGINTGPLGYEEGESLYDNRLLNRGWFPEKIIWDFGTRAAAKVGSDPAMLEFLTDYRKSFAHDPENYGKTPENEAFRSLGWANNSIFNAIDDIVEGSGIEDDIPFSPAHSEKLWHYFEHKSRPTSRKLEEHELRFKSAEDTVRGMYEEAANFGPDSEPTEINGLVYGNFNLLGLNDFIVGSRVWSQARYLGGLEHSEIPGVSLAIADNELYDGIRTDFHNFLVEKLPPDPLNGFRQTDLPKTIEGLDGAGRDTPGSRIPGFSAYIWQNKPNAKETVRREQNNQYFRLGQDFNKSEMRSKTRSRIERQSYSWDTFRPKDEFSFAPTTGNTQVFETEWVVDGEGWLGNVGSTKAILGYQNLPISYIDPIATVFTQPKGVHSSKIADDESVFAAETNPYFSLTDFTENRIIRGSENDTSAFPILQAWNMYTPYQFQKNFRTKNDTLFFSKDLTGSWAQNTNNITFENGALSQRDLWWRSVESGTGNLNSKNELGISLIKDSGEKYRDFLLAYDYRLFGKSWLTPQENKVPLKSYQFYNDSKLNDWIAYRESFESANLGVSNTWENQLYSDYTYGLFVNSNINMQDTQQKYSIRVRDYLFYIYNIGIVYLTSLYVKLFNILQILSNFFFNLIYFKLEILLFFIKYFINLNINSTLVVYLLHLVQLLVLLLYNIYNIFFLTLQEIANNVNTLDTGDFFENLLIIEIFNLTYSGTFFKYFNVLAFLNIFNLIKYFEIVIQFIFLNLLIVTIFILI